jgi:15-cis-phytoene synthase
VGPDVTPPRAAADAQGRTSFSASFAFLPAQRRKALAAVYAFCRATDDIADRQEEPAGTRAERLRAWKSDLDRALAGGPAPPVLTELASVASRYDIPRHLFGDLVRGVGMDLATVRYSTFAELEEYCRLVASAVGLMCLDIFGRRNHRTEAYARDLGIALQLTNIIRDVRADASMGRVYIPLEDLGRFGCATDELLSGADSDRFRRLLAFQADRAETFYARASAALDRSDLAAMRPALVMQAIYHRLLRNIRRSSYDVLGRTIRVTRAERLAIAVRHGVLGVFFAR